MLRSGLLAGFLVLTASAYTGVAQAAPILSVFNFTGDCDDCAGPNGLLNVPGTNLHDGFSQAVSGVLTLQDYTPGSALTDSNIFSFSLRRLIDSSRVHGDSRY